MQQTLCYTEGMELDGYYTVKQAAELLGVGGQRIRDLIREGRLEAEKLGMMWYIRKESVHDFERVKPWDIRKSEKST